jgi:hypothetical protein
MEFAARATRGGHKPFVKREGAGAESRIMGPLPIGESAESVVRFSKAAIHRHRTVALSAADAEVGGDDGDVLCP